MTSRIFQTRFFLGAVMLRMLPYNDWAKVVDDKNGRRGSGTPSKKDTASGNSLGAKSQLVTLLELLFWQRELLLKAESDAHDILDEQHSFVHDLRKFFNGLSEKLESPNLTPGKRLATDAYLVVAQRLGCLTVDTSRPTESSPPAWFSSESDSPSQILKLLPRVANTLCGQRTIWNDKNGSQAIGNVDEQLEALCMKPLQHFGRFIENTQRKDSSVSILGATLALEPSFLDKDEQQNRVDGEQQQQDKPLSYESHVAEQLSKRIKKDLAEYARAQEENEPQLACLRKWEIEKCIEHARQQSWHNFKSYLNRAQDELRRLRIDLHDNLEEDLRLAALECAQAESLANCEASDDLVHTETAYSLRQIAGLEPRLTFTSLVTQLISSGSEKDIQRLNPVLSLDVIRRILQIVALAMLRTSRVAFVRGVISEVQSLNAEISTLLTNAEKCSFEEIRRVACGILHMSTKIGIKLCMQRSYVATLPERSGEGAKSEGAKFWYDPRFLLFEFTAMLILRAPQVKLVRDFVRTVLSRYDGEWRPFRCSSWLEGETNDHGSWKDYRNLALTCAVSR